MPKTIEQQLYFFKEGQNASFMAVTNLRNDYYDGKVARPKYIKLREEVGQDFFTGTSSVIEPSSTDIEWIKAGATETLRQEEALVPPKTTGLTEQESKLLCLLQLRHAEEFIDQFVERNFNSLQGLDYKRDYLTEYLGDEDEKNLYDEILETYETLWVSQ